jgi:cob(I)alamin adenosyltransferase
MPMKIYTRTGDEGDTGLFDGTRVPKSDPMVDAYGDVDELNAVLGLVRAEVADEQLGERIVRLQRDLFALGARLADPRGRIAERVTKAGIGIEDVARLEAWIDEFEERLSPLRRFIIPGGGRAGATLHLARTVCRRAERKIVALGKASVDPVVVAYVNRLSDLLFVLARLVNRRASAAEVEW